jgi:rRNA maturation protein Nop10
MHTDEQAPDPTAMPDTASAVSEPAHCYHCGMEAPEGTDAGADWLCDECGRYQQSQICPTCHSVVNVSQLPEGMVPEAHAPKKRKKGKE